MAPRTRNKSNQATLEDLGAGRTQPAKSKGSKTTPSKKAGAQKRKNESTQDYQKSDTKKAKTLKTESEDKEQHDDETVTINRAPVLELWGGCVTQFLHPSLSWESCLSVGGAISTIAAISKGRSIGTISKPDPGEAQERKQKRKEKQGALDEVEVMSFHLRLDSQGQAVVGDKPKKAGEEALIKKYGGAEQYGKVKSVFQEALSAWQGKEEELDSRAFHFYEDFRPTVPAGQQGWGRKGQLRLEAIKEVVSGN